MIEQVIMFLITVCVIALVVYLVIYVLRAIGVPLPPMVLKIMWIIFGLIVLLYLLRLVIGAGGISLPMLIPWLAG